MHQPIRRPPDEEQPAPPPAAPIRHGNYLRALLRMFADLACRLR